MAQTTTGQATNFDSFQRKITAGEQTTTSGTFVNQHTQTSDPLVAGVYLVSYSMELSVSGTGGGPISNCRVQTEVNAAGGNTRNIFSEDTTTYQTRSGQMFESVSEGDTITITVDLRQNGGGGQSARIRKIRTSLVRVAN